MLTTAPFPQRVAASVCVRENLPQSFHSLAVSEPDPITLFTPIHFICLAPEQRPCHEDGRGPALNLVPSNFPVNTGENFPPPRLGEIHLAFPLDGHTVPESYFSKWRRRLMLQADY